MPGHIQAILTRHRRLLTLAILAGGVGAVLVWGAVFAGPTDPFAADYSDHDLAQHVERGLAVFTEQNCAECHATRPPQDASAVLKGPTLAGIVGATVVLEDGRSVTRGHRYLRRAVRDPQAELVRGYSFQVMPEYSHLSEADVVSLLLYLRSLDEAGSD